jgi:hypothetical protein
MNFANHYNFVFIIDLLHLPLASWAKPKYQLQPFSLHLQAFTFTKSSCS